MFYCKTNKESKQTNVFQSTDINGMFNTIFDFDGANNMLQRKKGHLPDLKQHMMKARCFSQINVKIQ